MTITDETLERLRDYADCGPIIGIDLRALLDDHARLRGELLRVRIDDKGCSGFGGDPDEAAALADKGREAFLSYRLAVKCREHRINNARLRAENEALRGQCEELSCYVREAAAADEHIYGTEYSTMMREAVERLDAARAALKLAKADGGDATGPHVPDAPMKPSEAMGECAACDGRGSWEEDRLHGGGGEHYTEDVKCQTCGGTGESVVGHAPSPGTSQEAAEPVPSDDDAAELRRVIAILCKRHLVTERQLVRAFDEAARAALGEGKAG